MLTIVLYKFSTQVSIPLPICIPSLTYTDFLNASDGENTISAAGGSERKWYYQLNGLSWYPIHVFNYQASTTELLAFFVGPKWRKRISCHHRSRRSNVTLQLISWRRIAEDYPLKFCFYSCCSKVLRGFRLGRNSPQGWNFEVFQGNNHQAVSSHHSEVQIQRPVVAQIRVIPPVRQFMLGSNNAWTWKKITCANFSAYWLKYLHCLRGQIVLKFPWAAATDFTTLFCAIIKACDESPTFSRLSHVCMLPLTVTAAAY